MKKAMVPIEMRYDIQRGRFDGKAYLAAHSGKTYHAAAQAAYNIASWCMTENPTAVDFEENNAFYYALFCLKYGGCSPRILVRLYEAGVDLFRLNRNGESPIFLSTRIDQGRSTPMHILGSLMEIEKRITDYDAIGRGFEEAENESES